jgi:F-type H+-transporting ATPase subunit a
MTAFAEAVVFQIGPLRITHSIVVTWGIMFILALCSWAVTRRLQLQPGPLQTVLEGVVGAMHDAIRAVLPDHAERVLPFIGTLWMFIVLANLVGLIPGIHAPTGDLSVTAALAVLVFFSVHWFGIRIEGIGPYLRHYLAPSPLLLPFHLVSEISRTLTLAVRLFGNMMSLEMAALLVLVVAGFLAPIPLLMLHIVEALIQAYIFGMLALIYLAGAIQIRTVRSPLDKG